MQGWWWSLFQSSKVTSRWPPFAIHLEHMLFHLVAGHEHLHQGHVAVAQQCAHQTAPHLAMCACVRLSICRAQWQYCTHKLVQAASTHRGPAGLAAQIEN